MALWNDIFQLATAMCPDLDEREQAVLMKLCAAAESVLKSRLRSGLSPEDCAECFCCAAAWLAVDSLRAGGMEEIGSFTAGNVSINRSGGVTGSLRQRAMELMAPYLAADSAFLGVRG